MAKKYANHAAPDSNKQKGKLSPSSPPIPSPPLAGSFPRDSILERGQPCTSVIITTIITCTTTAVPRPLLVSRTCLPGGGLREDVLLHEEAHQVAAWQELHDLEQTTVSKMGIGGEDGGCQNP